jgi:hypothetical protein
MKILAIEREVSGIAEDVLVPHLRAEAFRALELYLDGVIRELYFRADHNAAILILECEGLEEAKKALATLPLVQQGLIEFDFIPLAPYPGFKRLLERG